MTQQAKFTYFFSQESNKKQTKTIENQGKEQVEAVKDLKPTIVKVTINDVIPIYQLNEEGKNELDTN